MRRDGGEDDLGSLAALLGDDASSLTTAAASGDAFAQALSAGSELAFVARVHRGADECATRLPLSEGTILLPLIDTRRHAVITAGNVGLKAMWDGFLMTVAVSPSRGRR
jgi:hypothetical protein